MKTSYIHGILSSSLHSISFRYFRRTTSFGILRYYSYLLNHRSPIDAPPQPVVECVCTRRPPPPTTSLQAGLETGKYFKARSLKSLSSVIFQERKIHRFGYKTSLRKHSFSFYDSLRSIVIYGSFFMKTT